MSTKMGSTTLTATSSTMSPLTMSRTLNPTTPVFSLHRRRWPAACRAHLADTRPSRRIVCGGARSHIRLAPGRQLSRDSVGVHLRVDCVSSSAGGGFVGDDGCDGNGGGGGDGGDGAAEGGEATPSAVAAVDADVGDEDLSALSPDVITLDVKGMSCEGCAGKVKRILESQPQVASASVDLATETALVWPVPEAKVEPDWQTQLGEALANHLTSCGFESKLKGYLAGEEAMEEVVSS